METTEKKWQKTKTAHLLRNSESGKYYARLYRDGKEIWKSLKTKSYPVAVAKLAEEAKVVRQAVKRAATVESGAATVETLSKMYLEREQLRRDLKPSMKHYRAQCVGSDLQVRLSQAPTQERHRGSLSAMGVPARIFGNQVQQYR